MRLDVTTQPVPLNIAGDYSDFLIYNEGPDTVYVDTTGSAEPDFSMPLAPLTYLPWKRGIPTWLVSRGLSRVRTQPTTDAPSVNGSARQQLIASNRGKMVGFSNEEVISLSECSAYQTLIISYTTTLAFTIASEFILWAVDWYDSSGAFLERTQVGSGPQKTGSDSLSDGYVSRMWVPVRGAFFKVICVYTSSASLLNFDMQVTGDTQSKPLFVSTSFGLLGENVVSQSGGSIVNWSEDFVRFRFKATGLGTLFDSLAFKSIAPNIRMSFDFNAGSQPTVGSNVTIYSAVNQGSRIIAQQTVATATRYQDFVFTGLPLSIPLYIGFTGGGPTCTSDPYMSMNWFN